LLDYGVRAEQVKNRKPAPLNRRKTDIMKHKTRSILLLLLLSLCWLVTAHGKGQQTLREGRASLSAESANTTPITTLPGEPARHAPTQSDPGPQVTIVGDARKMAVVTQKGAPSHSALFVYTPTPPQPAPVAFFAVTLTLLGIRWRHRAKSSKGHQQISPRTTASGRWQPSR